MNEDLNIWQLPQPEGSDPGDLPERLVFKNRKAIEAKALADTQGESSRPEQNPPTSKHTEHFRRGLEFWIENGMRPVIPIE